MSLLQIPSAARALLAAALLLGLAPASAEPQPEAIAETIDEAAKICRDAGGKPDTAAVLGSDDLNGDGKADWIVDYAKLKCEGSRNPACNPAGCMLQLYYRSDDTWDLVFEDFVKTYKFSSSGTTRTMHVTTSGIPCNKAMEETCTYTYRFEKDAIAPVQ